MRARQEKPVDPRFRLQRGEKWHRGARVSKPVAAPREAQVTDCSHQACAGAAPCCDSCHEDFDGGYSEPVEVETLDGVTLYVCCRKADHVSRREAP